MKAVVLLVTLWICLNQAYCRLPLLQNSTQPLFIQPAVKDKPEIKSKSQKIIRSFKNKLSKETGVENSEENQSNKRNSLLLRMSKELRKSWNNLSTSKDENSVINLSKENNLENKTSKNTKKEQEPTRMNFSLNVNVQNNNKNMREIKGIKSKKIIKQDSLRKSRSLREDEIESLQSKHHQEKFVEITENSQVTKNENKIKKLENSPINNHFHENTYKQRQYSSKPSSDEQNMRPLTPIAIEKEFFKNAGYEKMYGVVEKEKNELSLSMSNEALEKYEDAMLTFIDKAVNIENKIVSIIQKVRMNPEDNMKRRSQLNILCDKSMEALEGLIYKLFEVEKSSRKLLVLSDSLEADVLADQVEGIIESTKKAILTLKSEEERGESVGEINGLENAQKNKEELSLVGANIEHQIMKTVEAKLLKRYNTSFRLYSSSVVKNRDIMYGIIQADVSRVQHQINNYSSRLYHYQKSNFSSYLMRLLKHECLFELNLCEKLLLKAKQILLEPNFAAEKDKFRRMCDLALVKIKNFRKKVTNMQTQSFKKNFKNEHKESTENTRTNYKMSQHKNEIEYM